MSPLLRLFFIGGAVAACTGSLLSQSAQKAAEIACVQELRQQGGSLWATRTIKREEGHVLEYRRLETVDGIVQKLISVDGHAPDGSEKAKNDAILHALLTDPAARKKMADTAHADDVRLKQNLGLIPVMFLFQDKSNDGVIRVLTFHPDPAYKPNTYEERALHSLAGEVRIDVKTGRIEMLDAVISEPVKFGYGLLGSVTQGGTIHIQFVNVGDGIWKTQQAKLHVDGHIALVKSLSKTEDSERLDFKRLPGGFTIPAALNMLQVSR